MRNAVYEIIFLHPNKKDIPLSKLKLISLVADILYIEISFYENLNIIERILINFFKYIYGYIFLPILETKQRC